MFSLSGKRVLVTGASSGIGRQVAISAAEFGAQVTLVGRNEQRLQETKDQLKGDGHQAVAIDLTDVQQLKNFIGDTTPFDGIVFNAGIVEYAPVKFLNPEKINSVFDTNFNSTVLLCQGLLKNKQVKKKGSLVFISSISSKIGVAGTAMYAASKAAVSAFARVVASEVAGQQIRSNSICPGIVVTPMTAQAQDVASSEAMDEGAKAYPLGYGTPEDVAGLVIYLLSDAGRWMTGNDLILDGGLTLN